MDVRSAFAPGDKNGRTGQQIELLLSFRTPVKARGWALVAGVAANLQHLLQTCSDSYAVALEYALCVKN